MIDRRLRTKTTLIGVSAFVVSALVVKIATINLADWAARNKSAPVADATSTFSSSASVLADIALAEGRHAEAEKLTRAALENSPLSVALLRTFGLAMEAQGEWGYAGQAMTLAGSRGWRDTPTQLWLLDAYLRQGDVSSALTQVDALARRGEFLPKMISILVESAMVGPSRSFVIERLEQRPPWQDDFFEAARSLSVDRISDWKHFLRDLSASDYRYTTSNIEPFASNLYDRGLYAEANEVWRRYAGVPIEPGNAILDGDFEAARFDGRKEISPFEWHFRRNPGTDIGTGTGTPPARTDENALFIGSRGNVPAEMASQALAVSPGVHFLTFERWVEQGSKDGYRWAISCLPSGENVQLSPKISMVTNAWDQLTYRFTVPASGCDGQILSLHLESDLPQPIRVWISGVTVN